MNDENGAHHTCEGDHGPDAEIDTTADDDHGHAHGGDGHDHGLGQDDFEITARQEVLANLGFQGEEGDHEHQTEKGSQQSDELAESAWVGGDRHGKGGIRRWIRIGQWPRQ
jgi:hypothetical protein